jgi:hypothetical protein
MNFEDYMMNYDIFFLDGSRLSLENVAISSKNEKSRTCFINKDGYTVCVVPDCALKYILKRK